MDSNVDVVLSFILVTAIVLIGLYVSFFIRKKEKGNLQKDWALLLQAEANDDLTGIESLCAALLHNKFLDQEKFNKILTLIASHKDSFENYGIIKESAFNKKKQMERAYPY